MAHQTPLTFRQRFYLLSNILLVLGAPLAIAKTRPLDVMSIPLEDLLQIKYIPASQIASQVSSAASAVSVVTAQDIEEYGYRTLEEILASMRGLHITRDYSYSYLGGRGFSDPNEYAGRIIMLIDGYRADDSFYGQTYFGNNGLLDVSLIEKVEFIPGGGSAGYANGALLGAINITTKNASDAKGVRVAYGRGSYNSQEKRVTAGEVFDNGASILLFASTLNANQKEYRYEDIHQEGSKEKTTRFFVKANYETFSFTSSWAKRAAHFPSFPLLDIVGDPAYNGDENMFVRLKHDTDLSSSLKLSSSAWYGHYLYRYKDEPDPSNYIWHGGTTAKWYGADMKFVGSWFDNHTLSFGAEYRHDFRWFRYYDYFSFSWGSMNDGHYFTPRKTYSGYLYDDFQLSPTLKLNYGFRYEKNNANMQALSPHASLLWQVHPKTTLKFSANKTHRQPTAHEGVFDTPEQAKTYEFVAEQKLGDNTTLLASLYQYTLSHTYSYTQSDVHSKGAELEFAKHWDSGVRLRTSYAWQNVKNVSSQFDRFNSPVHLGKFNLSAPLFDNRLRVGLETHYTSKRQIMDVTEKRYAPAYWLTHLSASTQHLAPNLTTRFKVRNIFNKQYENVTAFLFYDDSSTLRDQGRTFWLEMEYTFK